MRNISILAANSRYNYGDVLMPIVVNEYFKQKYHGSYKASFYSYLNRDMSYTGGYSPDSLCNYYSKIEEFDYSIIAGGQVLSATHSSMLPSEELSNNDHLQNLFDLSFRVVNKVNHYLSESICKKISKVNAPTPWIITGCQDKVIYNTVGGNLNNLLSSNKSVFEECIDNLSKSPYISIRSKNDFDFLYKYISCKLVPDSMGIFSQLYPVSKLESLISDSVFNIIDKKYFVFQISSPEGLKYTDIIIDQIISVCKSLNIGCILLPIGYAAMHDDRVVLNRIYSKLKSSTLDISLLDNLNIWDISYVLAHSNFFIGSSLHGCVISQSYGVPSSTIITNRPKTLDYLKSWDMSPVPGTLMSDFLSSAKVLSLDSTRRFVSCSSSSLNSLINDNYRAIESIVFES